jgi:hypothetical protein
MLDEIIPNIPSILGASLDKPTIKVFIIIGSSLTTTNKTIDSEGNALYSGFTWDIWKKIEESLKDKYNFEVSFSPEKSTNYNIYVNDIATGKYDIAIGSFFNTKWREGKIDFSSPILIDANSILHEHETSIVSNLQTVLVRAGSLILYLILMGIFFGILLYYVDPKRIKQFPDFKNSKYLFFLRSIVTGIATMFGEMGFLVENPSLNIAGIILIIMTMTIAFLYIMFIQAEITTVVINQSGKSINHNNIGHKTFLGWKSDPVPQKLKRYGANIELHEKISVDNMIKKYLNNKDKYRGIVLPYCFAYKYMKKYPTLRLSTDFGNELGAFVINPTKQTFKEDVNNVIINLKTTLQLQNICQVYFGNIDNVPVCSLT